MKKSFIILLLSCAAVIGFSQIACAKQPHSWKIGHVRPAGSVIDKDVRTFIASITQKTSGKIHFDVYPGNKLGDYSVVQERVSFGEVEMYIGPFGTAVDKKISLSFTPFLVSNWPEARRMYSSSSPLRKHMDSYLKAQNIKIVGGYPVYFGGLALTEKPDSPADPDVSKNTIIRIPPMRSFELTARELGFAPYPITWMYARMGLKTGMVGGVMGGGAEGYRGLPAIGYYLPVKDHFEYWYVYMNLDLWNSLPVQEQQIIVAAAAEMESSRYEHAEEHESHSLAELERAGITVLPISNEAHERMRTKVMTNVWPKMLQEIGPAFTEVVNYL
ncbi:MAG: TRAP transporter substrate-binding protein DctP, partial [Desulfopila sp.]|nr:TRAP transporter substrate-binding protein DctP [Desulfopila sp.]